MKSNFTHKGYHGVVVPDYEAGILHGEVAGLRDVVTFQGTTLAEAEAAFRDSVDDYLEFCAARGEAPDKPFSGRFVVRLDPALHKALALRAQRAGRSLNAYVAEKLAENA